MSVSSALGKRKAKDDRGVPKASKTGYDYFLDYLPIDVVGILMNYLGCFKDDEGALQCESVDVLLQVSDNVKRLCQEAIVPCLNQSAFIPSEFITRTHAAFLIYLMDKGRFHTLELFLSIKHGDYASDLNLFFSIDEIDTFYNYCVDRLVLEKVFEIFASWRGPNQEYFDWAKPYIFKNACCNYNIELIKMIFEWRSPNGDYFTPEFEMIKKPLLKGRILQEVLDLVLNWTPPGSDGKVPSFAKKNVAKLENFMIPYPEELLKKSGYAGYYFVAFYRGKDGFWIDIRKNTHVQLKVVFEHILFHIQFISRNPGYLIETLTNWLSVVTTWRGPHGEFVDLTQKRFTPIFDKVKHEYVFRNLLLSWKGPAGERLEL